MKSRIFSPFSRAAYCMQNKNVIILFKIFYQGVFALAHFL